MNGLGKSFRKNAIQNIGNIAVRLSENSRNSFVDLQSQKDKKRKTKINFSLNGEILHFDYESV